MKTAAALTLQQVRAKARQDGKFSIYPKLYLQVRDGAASVIFRYVSPITGRQCDMGLGQFNFKAINAGDTLAAFHARADELKAQVIAKRDPIIERDADQKLAKTRDAARIADAETFPELVEKFLAKRASKKRTAKHWDQWKKSLENHAYPAFGDKPWREITKVDVVAMLDPLWKTMTVTASRVRNRCERAFEFGLADDTNPGPNPAALGYVNIKLDSASEHHSVAHFKPLDFDNLPAMMAKLKARKPPACKALQLVILTACRSDTARGATWGEFDLEHATWTVPRARMKSRRDEARGPWECPLSEPALDLLRSIKPADAKPTDFLFVGRNGPMAHDRMLRHLKNAGGEHVHGARSALVQWAKRSGWRDAAEFQLDHQIGDDTERAYAQGETLLEQRRAMMKAWADVILPQSNVVPFDQARAG